MKIAEITKCLCYSMCHMFWVISMCIGILDSITLFSGRQLHYYVGLFAPFPDVLYHEQNQSKVNTKAECQAGLCDQVCSPSALSSFWAVA